MTTSSYRGLFAHKLLSGQIVDVEVEEPAGNTLQLSLAEYERRGVQPVAESLPDQHQYKP